jgi:antirestriction protein ArdC
MPNSRMADARTTGRQRRPCGIIRIAALCPLCRYRHNAHATGHPSRLNRDLSGRFGSSAYAREELRAELTSLLVGSEIGLPTDIPNHASYVNSWVESLKQDKREIFRAAADAQRIADTILALHPGYAASPDNDDRTDDVDVSVAAPLAA